MLDLVISGGKVVTANGVGPWDVAIKGEKIVALATPGTLPREATRTIDATGKIVVPGGIDPHVHLNWPLPDPRGGAAMRTVGPAQVSRAALFGGTTTLVDFALVPPGESLERVIETHEEESRGHFHTDYAYHLMLQGHPLAPELYPQIAEAIQAGYPSFKVFTTDVTPSRRAGGLFAYGRKLEHGDIWELLQVVAKAGGMVAVHGEDDEIVMHQYDKLIREGRVGVEYMPEIHSSLAEDLAFRRIIRMAELIDGAALYMVHVSAASGVRAIAESRTMGYPIYGETLHNYANMTRAAYQRPNAAIYHVYPSLKEEEDCKALWEGLADGTISTVATDGVCTSLEVKLRGKRVDDVTGGHAGVEPRVAVTYTEAVVNRGFSLEHFVDIVSTNAAKIMGMYPRKGAIAIDSDADIVVIDPSIERVIRKEDLHETDYSVWEGWKVAGWPVVTVLRGKVVVKDGEFFGQPADGKWIKRKISEDILSGPAI